MSRSSSIQEGISSIIGAAFTLWLFWFIFGDMITERANKEKTAKSINYATPAYVVNYKALADEFEANSVVAESKYEGKVIHVQGPIHSIDNGLSGSPYITISGEYDFAMIRCEVEEGSRGALSSLRKGESVTISGLVGDTTMGVSLDPCKVVNSGEQARTIATPPSEVDGIQAELAHESAKAEREMDSAINQFERDFNNSLNGL